MQNEVTAALILPARSDKVVATGITLHSILSAPTNIKVKRITLDEQDGQ
jgi:hypothetical protein